MIAVKAPSCPARPKLAMTQHIKFQQTCLNGVEAMDAVSARSFPRHTHDQYGIGMIDHTAQASVSDSRQVEAGPGDLIFVNPGEVHDAAPSVTVRVPGACCISLPVFFSQRRTTYSTAWMPI